MRYAIAVILVIFIIIVGIVVLVGRAGRSDNTPTTKITKLSDYADNDNAKISLTTQGRLVGENDRRAIRVTVTEKERVIEVLQGYEEKVIKSHTFANTQAAFATFLQALDQLNFGRERNVKQTDERGACPLGNRFIYQLNDGGQQVFRTWSDSCFSNTGTYGGNSSTTRQLFRNQISDYSRLVGGVSL